MISLGCISDIFNDITCHLKGLQNGEQTVDDIVKIAGEFNIKQVVKILAGEMLKEVRVELNQTIPPPPSQFCEITPSKKSFHFNLLDDDPKHLAP